MTLERANADISVALRYHEQTKHAEHRVCGRPAPDPENKPTAYKTYASLPTVPRPPAAPESRFETLQILTSPVLGIPRAIPDAGELLHLCLHANGLLAPERPGSPTRRPASCTGALHHVELYVVCGDLGALPAGVYHYAVATHRLEVLRRGDHRSVLRAATAGEESVSTAPAVVVCASTVWRNAWKYGERSYRHVFWDSGTVVANLTTLASALGLPSRIVLGFVDAAVGELLGLDPAREPVVALVPIGRGGTEAPLVPVCPLRTTVAPASRAEAVFPGSLRLQQASSLRTTADVATWRDAAVSGSTATVSPALPRSRLPFSEPVERVIRRRNSARAFLSAGIDGDALGVLLRTAGAAVDADYGRGTGAGCVRTHAVVHAVDGLQPGAYVMDDVGSLAALRPGSLRAEATDSALGQRAAGDAAVTFYLVSDVPAVLGRMGNRGYRAAQITAGLIAGRLYLGACALGLAATGLTFYDDAAVRLLAPRSGLAQVMLVLAVGHPPVESAPS